MKVQGCTKVCNALAECRREFARFETDVRNDQKTARARCSWALPYTTRCLCWPGQGKQGDFDCYFLPTAPAACYEAAKKAFEAMSPEVRTTHFFLWLQGWTARASFPGLPLRTAQDEQHSGMPLAL